MKRPLSPPAGDSSTEIANAIASTRTFYFSEHEVRIVEKDGEPWWVGNDVCAVLGLSEPKTSMRSLDEDEKGEHTMPTLGGPQKMTIVSEAGMYSLTLRSRKPEAKAFRRWVTHEVLPSIRKTGGYGDSSGAVAAMAASVGELAKQVAELVSTIRATPAPAAVPPLVKGIPPTMDGWASEMRALVRTMEEYFGLNVWFDSPDAVQLVREHELVPMLSAGVTDERQLGRDLRGLLVSMTGSWIDGRCLVSRVDGTATRYKVIGGPEI